MKQKHYEISTHCGSSEPMIIKADRFFIDQSSISFFIDGEIVAVFLHFSWFRELTNDIGN